MLEHYHEGLICTSACIGGEIPRLILADKPAEAMSAALWYQRVFGDDFYLEVSLHQSNEPVLLAQDDDPAAYRRNNEALVRKQKESNAAVLLLGSLLDIKVVATNDQGENQSAHRFSRCECRSYGSSCQPDRRPEGRPAQLPSDARYGSQRGRRHR